MKTGYLEQLIQLMRVTWDGDLISKTHRDELVKNGYAQRSSKGFNVITLEGIEVLSNLGVVDVK